MPHPKEGHLSAVIDGAPSRNACECLPTRSVPTITVWGLSGVPQRIKWGLEPVLISLSGALVQGVNTLGEPACEPSFLSVDLSQFTLGDHSPEVSAPCRTSTPTSPSHLTKEHPLKQIVTSA